MEQNSAPLVNACNMASVNPIMVDLPYPPVQVQGQNQVYANILSIDYCGAVSEMTAIAQYINHENRLSCDRCPLAKTILGIAMAEMIHLQKLGELIFLLGGSIEFVAKPPNGRPSMWTPEYFAIQNNVKNMLLADIEGEKAAIHQYKMHSKVIQDSEIRAVLARIIKDEEYHIMILQSMLQEL